MPIVADVAAWTPTLHGGKVHWLAPTSSTSPASRSIRFSVDGNTLMSQAAKSIRILNKRNGVLTQVVINTLSDDNNTINNEYIRMDKDGKITGVTHVTYNRRKK